MTGRATTIGKADKQASPFTSGSSRRAPKSSNTETESAPPQRTAKRSGVSRCLLRTLTLPKKNHHSEKKSRVGGSQKPRQSCVVRCGNVGFPCQGILTGQKCIFPGPGGQCGQPSVLVHTCSAHKSSLPPSSHKRQPSPRAAAAHTEIGVEILENKSRPGHTFLSKQI